MAGILLPAGCCCDCGDECVSCTGYTPKTVTVTFSSITLCSDCIDDGSNDYKLATPRPSVPVGPYILTQSPTSACDFIYEEAADVDEDVFGIGDCDGSLFNTINHDTLQIALSWRATNGIVLQAAWLPAGGGGTNLFAFASTTNNRSGQGCLGPYVVQNDTAGCRIDAFLSRHYYGQNGSATVLGKC